MKGLRLFNAVPHALGDAMVDFEHRFSQLPVRARVGKSAIHHSEPFVVGELGDRDRLAQSLAQMLEAGSGNRAALEPDFHFPRRSGNRRQREQEEWQREKFSAVHL